MSDMGFADAAAARSVSRRLVLRERVRCMVELGTSVLDRLDQASQADAARALALLAKDNGLLMGDGKGAIGGKPIDLIEGQNVREQELLEGSDFVLKFLDALLDGIGHGLFSTNVQTGAEPKPPVNAAHRLCEGAI